MSTLFLAMFALTFAPLATAIVMLPAGIRQYMPDWWYVATLSLLGLAGVGSLGMVVLGITGGVS